MRSELQFPGGVPPMLGSFINGPATTTTEELGVKPKKKSKKRSGKGKRVKKAEATLDEFEQVWHDGK